MAEPYPSRDLIDEEFILLTRVAKALLDKLKNPTDVAVTKHYLSKCEDFAKSENIEVNFKGVLFMRAFMKILKKSVDHQIPVEPPQEMFEECRRLNAEHDL